MCRSLSDRDKDHALNKEEFIVAMYLIQCKLNGEPLPERLPNTFFPDKDQYGKIPTITKESSKEKIEAYGTVEIPSGINADRSQKPQLRSPPKIDSSLYAPVPLNEPQTQRQHQPSQSSNKLLSPTTATTTVKKHAVEDYAAMPMPLTRGDTKVKITSVQQRRPSTENYDAIPKNEEISPSPPKDPKENYGAIPKDPMSVSPNPKENYGAIPRNDREDQNVAPQQKDNLHYGSLQKEDSTTQFFPSRRMCNTMKPSVFLFCFPTEGNFFFFFSNGGNDLFPNSGATCGQRVAVIDLGKLRNSSKRCYKTQVTQCSSQKTQNCRK